MTCLVNFDSKIAGNVTFEFADEIDAIGTKRFDSETSGDREVQRTMLELLNQLDGFGSDENIKVRQADATCKWSAALVVTVSIASR